jgi:hypothetical protein
MLPPRLVQSGETQDRNGGLLLLVAARLEHVISKLLIIVEAELLRSVVPTTTATRAAFNEPISTAPVARLFFPNHSLIILIPSPIIPITFARAALYSAMSVAIGASSHRNLLLTRKYNLPYATCLSKR